ncbi:hypothetical protein AVEN_36739-1 [Araneus ventricosus]|uniref:Uncharacterized protein n=1 Tax=Araneus ventricosus TaxID=182803 RepID=A0A4Y2WKF6_ARAVE|nr:hypothetical protein AVEN_36739-1 [Araneus ventricosus]
MKNSNPMLPHRRSTSMLARRGITVTLKAVIHDNFTPHPSMLQSIHLGRSFTTAPRNANPVTPTSTFSDHLGEPSTPSPTRTHAHVAAPTVFMVQIE